MERCLDLRLSVPLHDREVRDLTIRFWLHVFTLYRVMARGHELQNAFSPLPCHEKLLAPCLSMPLLNCICLDPCQCHRLVKGDGPL